MSKRRRDLVIYENQQLMEDLNEFFINCKVHLYGIDVDRPKPTCEEMDNLMFRLMEQLEKDTKPMTTIRNKS